MIQAMNKILFEIRNNIPLEVLNITFTTDRTGQILPTPVSLDEQITSSVIRPKVLMDCNIVSGTEMTIPLSQTEEVSNLERGYVVKVPKELTNYRSIVSVLSIVSEPFTSSLVLTGNNAPSYNEIGGNYEPGPIEYNTSLELVGDNIIFIDTYLANVFQLYIRVTIENNNNFSNINPKSHLHLANLNVLAVKAYIYNKLNIPLESAYMHFGYQLGVIREIVDSYSDAQEQYDEYLKEVWTKVAFMSDNAQMRQFVTSMFGNSI